MMIKKALTMLVLGTFALTSPVQAKEETFELSFQTMYNPAQAQMVEAFFPYAKAVEERSEGSLKIDIFGMGTLVPAMSEADAVKGGNLDIGQSALSQPKETPYSYLLSMMPDMCRSVEDTIAVGPILYSIPEIRIEFEKYGYPLGYASYVPLVIASINTPIKTPADVRGKRFLVTNTNQALLAEAWGAVPVMVALSDVYIGLQRGMGEFYLSGISWMKGSKIFEIAKQMTQVNYPNTNLLPFLINKELFDEMSENQRTILKEAADEYFGPVILESWQKDMDTAMQMFRDAGVNYYKPDDAELQIWRDTNKNVIPVALRRLEDLGIKDGMQFLDKVEKALQDAKFYD